MTIGLLVPDRDGHFDGKQGPESVVIETTWDHWPIALFVSGPLLGVVHEWRRAQANKMHPGLKYC